MLAAGSFTALGRPEGLVALAKFHMKLLAPENEVAEGSGPPWPFPD